MELSKIDAYEVLDLPSGACLDDVIRQYKFLALEWYPDKHNRNSTSLKKFQVISQSFLTFCLPDIPFRRNLMTLEEMLSLFQFIFFGNESLDEEDGEDDGNECSSDSGPEEDSFEEFYNDWNCENVELLKEAYRSLAAEEDSLVHKPSEDKKSTAEKTVNTTDAVQNAKELIQEEEREKRKAKKRRAQKKRRKEKKKQEKKKQEKELDEEEKKGADDDTDEEVAAKPQKPKEESSSESEEEIDPESAFVAVIAKKKNKNIPLKRELDSKPKSSDKDAALASQLEETSRVLRSRQLALRGNEMANSGHFQEAVQLFSEAIRLEPTDHRFYGNRSYCHDRLGNFERALNDAERSITLAPKVPKGYFRKGKALASLKRYAEAEKCFEEVLKLDEQCEDAVKEMFYVKTFQIMDMGFTREEAENAIEEHGSVQEALEFLLPTAAAARNQEDLFISDDDDEFLVRCVKPQPSAAVTDVKMDPNNPEGHNSIWVGNLQPGVTEKIVVSLFSKYGEILSVKFTPEKYFAFVNYSNTVSPGKAMRALQGAELYNKNLLIKFPNSKPAAMTKTGVSSQSTTKAKPFVVPVNGDECYFWRNLGCIHGNNCRYKHIKEHKGIDLRKATSKY